jgi:hypothetical protein
MYLYFPDTGVLILAQYYSGKRERRGFWHLQRGGGGGEKCKRIFDRKGRKHLNKLGVNRIIWILKKWKVAEWTSFI